MKQEAIIKVKIERKKEKLYKSSCPGTGSNIDSRGAKAPEKNEIVDSVIDLGFIWTPAVRRGMACHAHY